MSYFDPARQFVIDPTFDSPGAWELEGGWTVTGGKAVHTGGGTSLRQLFADLIIGETYDISLVVDTTGDLTLGNTIVQIKNIAQTINHYQKASSLGEIIANQVNVLTGSFVATETSAYLKVFSADELTVDDWTVTGKGIRLPNTIIQRVVAGFYFDFSVGIVSTDTILGVPATDGQTVGSVENLAIGTQYGQQTLAGDRPTFRAASNTLDFFATAAEEHIKTQLKVAPDLMSYVARVKVNPSSAGDDVLLGASSGTSRGWLGITDGILSAGVGDNTSAATQDSGATDLRHVSDYHVVGVRWNATRINLWLNGVEVLDIARSGGTPYNGNVLLGARNVGGSSEDLPFDGQISHALSTQTFLTDQEMLDVHNSWTPAGTYRYNNFAYFAGSTSPADQSFSAFAFKGNLMLATADFRIEQLRAWIRSSGGTDGDMVVARTDASGEILEILSTQAYTGTVVSTWEEVTLDVPAVINNGDYFLIGQQRNDGTGTSSAGIALHTGGGSYPSVNATFVERWSKQQTLLTVGMTNGQTGTDPWIMDYNGGTRI